MKVKTLGIGLVGVVLAGGLVLVWLTGGELKRAPEVELNLIQGGKTALTDLRAQRPVLVTFWATDCAPCRREVPHLVDLYEAYNNKGFDILAIAMSHDPPSRVWEFVRNRQIPYKIAVDLDSNVAQAFGDVRLTPTTYVLAKDGRVVFHKTGVFDIGKMRALIERLLAEPV